MEVFAGFLTHTDYHYGRLFNFLKSIGQWENTLIMFISDNGASAEGGPTGSVNENKFFNNVPDSLEQNLAMIDQLGGPTTFNHYAWGWTFAGNTPFCCQQRSKTLPGWRGNSRPRFCLMDIARAPIGAFAMSSRWVVLIRARLSRWSRDRRFLRLAVGYGAGDFWIV